MRVDPDESDFLFFAAEMAGNAGHRAHRHGMVAAQHQRDLLFGEGAIHHERQALAGKRDLRQVLGAVGTLRQAFRLIHRYVAQIVGMVAQRRQPLIQIGHANGGRPHVHAAAVLAEIQRRSDDGDVGMLHDGCL